MNEEEEETSFKIDRLIVSLVFWSWMHAKRHQYCLCLSDIGRILI